MEQIVTLIVIVFVLVLGSAVFLNNKKKPANIVFGLLVLSIVGWTISNDLADNTRQFSQALFWVRGSFAFTSLFLGMLWLFSHAYTEKGRLNPRIAIPISISAVIMFILSFTPAIVRTVELKSWGANTINGNYFFIFLIYFLLTLTGATLRLISRYKKVRGQQRQQIQYLFFGFSLSILFGATTNLILPLITGSTELAKYGPFGMVFLLAFTSFAIIRHRLLDIRLLVLKSVAYSISFGLVIAGYVAFTFLVFQELQLAVDQTAVNVAIVFVLILTFNPFKAFIQKITDQLFFRGRYKFNDLLSELINIAKQNSRDINALTGNTIRTLLKEMRLEQAAFVLSGSPNMSAVKTIGYEAGKKSLWDKLQKLAENATGIILADELDDNSASKILLRDHGIEAVLPIKTKRATIGALVLGQKKSGDNYNREDISLLELFGPQAAIAVENAESFVERGRRIAELKSLNKMFRHIEHFPNLDILLEEIVEEAISVTGAEGGSLMLVNKDNKTLSIKTAKNLHPLIKLNTKIRIGKGIAGTVAKTQEPLIINGLHDPDFKPNIKRENIHSAISVPMVTEDKLIGVLNMNRTSRHAVFAEESLTIIRAFASQAAEAIVKADHYNQIENLSLMNDTQFREFTRALARTVDAKDPYTYGHSEAVTRFAVMIAEELNLDEQRKRSLEIAGRLHDLGKIGIPESILNKPGFLTDEEYAAVRKHPEIGATILKHAESLKDVRDMILYHHERYDGAGYPKGLKGEEIPLEARILTVADSFDTMMSRRPYRESLSRSEAIAELKKYSGSQFDPKLVKIFIEMLHKRGLKVVKHFTWRFSDEDVA